MTATEKVLVLAWILTFMAFVMAMIGWKLA